MSLKISLRYAIKTTPLLKDIYKYIDDDSKTWSRSGNKIFQVGTSETGIAQFAVSNHPVDIIFDLVSTKPITRDDYAMMHGRLASFLLEHFSDDFTSMQISPKPGFGEASLVTDKDDRLG